VSEVLSQDEVDALLKGLSGGDIEAETSPQSDSGEARHYDFTSQDRIVRGRMPTLEMIHDRFARSFRASLTNAIRRMVDVTVLKTEMSKCGEFLRGIPLPSSLHLIRLDPLRGLGLLVLEGNLVFAIVDTYFGGSGASNVKLEGRDFTIIEQRLIRRIVDIAIEDYQEAWGAAHPVEIIHQRSEVNPQFVNIAPPTDVVVSTAFELEIEEASGKMTFCLPYPTIAPIKDLLRAGPQSESARGDGDWSSRLSEQIGGVDVEVAAVLGHADITGNELLQLRVGDVIALRENSERPVDILIEDVLKCCGRVGVQHGSRAVQIESVHPLKR
jgi:flagellar motor switch protein FliM